MLINIFTIIFFFPYTFRTLATMLAVTVLLTAALRNSVVVTENHVWSTLTIVSASFHDFSLQNILKNTNYIYSYFSWYTYIVEFNCFYYFLVLLFFILWRISTFMIRSMRLSAFHYVATPLLLSGTRKDILRYKTSAINWLYINLMMTSRER